MLDTPEILAAVKNSALGRALQPDHGPHHRRLAAAAPAHDDKDIPLADHEIKIALDDKLAIGHGQVADLDMGRLVHDFKSPTGRR